MYELTLAKMAGAAQSAELFREIGAPEEIAKLFDKEIEFLVATMMVHEELSHLNPPTGYVFNVQEYLPKIANKTFRHPRHRAFMLSFELLDPELETDGLVHSDPSYGNVVLVLPVWYVLNNLVEVL